MNVQYTYTVLRYLHDVVTGEFINVGVVMHIPRQHRVLARTQSRATARIRAMFPSLDGIAFNSSMRAVQRTLDATKHVVSEPDAAAFAKGAVPMDSSSLQWSPQGSGISSNVEETFERLYERHVTHYESFVIGNESVDTVGAGVSVGVVTGGAAEWPRINISVIDPLANNSIGVIFGNPIINAAPVQGAPTMRFLAQPASPARLWVGGQDASTAQFALTSNLLLRRGETPSIGIPRQ
jgi:hypothetical protein